MCSSDLPTGVEFNRDPDRKLGPATAALFLIISVVTVLNARALRYDIGY